MLNALDSDAVTVVLQDHEGEWPYHHFGDAHTAMNGFALSGRVREAIQEDAWPEFSRSYEKIKDVDGVSKGPTMGLVGQSRDKHVCFYKSLVSPPKGYSHALVSICHWRRFFDRDVSQDARCFLQRFLGRGQFDEYIGEEKPTAWQITNILRMISEGQFGDVSYRSKREIGSLYARMETEEVL